jgi:mycothiol synthase
MSTETIEATGQAGAIVRPARSDDAAAILLEMLEALSRGEYDAVEPYQLAHAAERIAANPAICAVAEVDGRLAGWVVSGDDDLMVVPEYRRRGLGRRLVAAGRGIAAAEGHELLRLWVRRRPGPEAFARACGLRYASSLWQMRLTGRDLAGLPEPVFPPGMAARTFSPGLDDGPFITLVNRIFLDHPSPIHLNEAEVRRVHAEPDFDPATILVVEEMTTGDMAGFCRVVPFAASDGSPAGEVRLLGVDRPWRGRGLGRAVTAWGVAELRRRGAETVVLAVEGQNDQAHKLYRDLGFRFGAEWPHWTIAASPATGR